MSRLRRELEEVWGALNETGVTGVTGVTGSAVTPGKPSSYNGYASYASKPESLDAERRSRNPGFVQNVDEADCQAHIDKKPQRRRPNTVSEPGDADALGDALARLGPMTDGMAMDALGWGGTRVWQAMQALVGRGAAVYDERGRAVIWRPD